MKHYKSERLKKLETELFDLEQWLKLGLVPKRDIVKHKEEIQAIQEKIEEEQERLQFLRESGESEEYVAPKRSQTRGTYTEMPTIPDIDVADTVYHEGSEEGETNHDDGETTMSESRTGNGENSGEHSFEEEDESYFSDRNRWKRGGNIIDPDANDW